MVAATLESICSRISSGGTPSRKNAAYFADNPGAHLWVKSKELLDCSISDTEERISDEGLKNSSAKYYPAHSVLVAMYGANVGQLGWLRTPATVNQAICGLVVDDLKADWRSCFSLLHTRSDDHQAQERTAGLNRFGRQFAIPRRYECNGGLRASCRPTTS
jgi:type I restriction enzyme S subunit